MAEEQGESSSIAEGNLPMFYVGHHESRRQLPVTEEVLRQAQDSGVRIF